MGIDRAEWVRRHNPRRCTVDARAPLQLGNGQFALNVDLTGLQTFPQAYPASSGSLLSTMAHWGWHTMPGGETFDIQHCQRRYDTVRGPLPFTDLSRPLWAASVDGTGAGGQVGVEGTAEEVFFRANPHRFDLGRIGLMLPQATRIEDLSRFDQRLDLYTGQLVSTFNLGRDHYEVETLVDWLSDTVLIRCSTAAARTGIRLDFAYANQSANQAQDWGQPAAHLTRLVRLGDEAGAAVWWIERVMDDTTYAVRLVVPSTQVEVVLSGPHQVEVSWSGGAPEIQVSFEAGSGAAWSRFLRRATGDEAAVIRRRTAVGWAQFWSGGAISLNRSDQVGALELERRIVLSRYLTRINSAGRLPVPETGLYANSWRGKFHLEMQWWHLAHFALWGNPEIVERVLGWYDQTLPQVYELAGAHGLPGGRWPKSSGPEARETPSSIGAFLIWQQPHPIYLAELVRRATPGDEVVQRWWPVVSASATFMASYPVAHSAVERWWVDRPTAGVANPAGLNGGGRLGPPSRPGSGDDNDPAVASDRLVFPPPLIPAQECYAADRSLICDPTFELVYWAWGLRVAADWARRVGQFSLSDHWQRIARRLSRPRPVNGLYPAIGAPRHTQVVDHPSMLAGLGVTPDIGWIDPAVMAATLEEVMRHWSWPTTWGWDYPLMALTATRVGRPDLAVRALLMDQPKNTYLGNGHNWQTTQLPAYLPGNGGLLAAVALMGAGFDGGAPRPGFGPDWVVEVEGIRPSP